jgi:purine-binding chemotaxis protein CheW
MVQELVNECAKPSERTRHLLEQRARVLARLLTEQDDESDSLNLMTLRLGEEWYGIEIHLVQEVQPLLAGSWSLVPCTPKFIVGAVNIRGQIHSVMDLGSFFGLPQRQLSDSAHVLLVRGGSEGDGGVELCVLTDELPEVMVVPMARMQPAPASVPTRAQEYVRGVTTDMLTVLDLERLLSDPLIIVNEEV